MAFGWAPRYLSACAPAMHARVEGVRRGKELDSRGVRFGVPRTALRANFVRNRIGWGSWDV